MSSSAATPAPLTAYFESVNAGETRKALACFAPDATVHDENRDHAGSAAIGEWLEKTGREYHPKLSVNGVEEREDRVLAEVTVSGDFPGSPAQLTFAFTLKEEKITSLRIS